MELHIQIHAVFIWIGLEQLIFFPHQILIQYAHHACIAEVAGRQENIGCFRFKQPAEVICIPDDFFIDTDHNAAAGIEELHKSLARELLHGIANCAAACFKSCGQLCFKKTGTGRIDALNNFAAQFDQYTFGNRILIDPSL